MKNISISKGALNKLTMYPWPGNVRQLENIIERAIVLCSGSEIGANIIEEEINRLETYDYDAMVSNDTDSEIEKGLLKNVEEDMILKVLKETGGNRTLAAKRLGISTTTLWRRLKQLKEDQEDKQLM